MPRAHSDASLSIYAPSIAGMSKVMAFFERAGERSAMLRPASWQAELHPLLWLEPGKPEQWAASGLDSSKDYTVSLVGENRFACATVMDIEAFEAKVSARLKALGTVVPR